MSFFEFFYRQVYTRIFPDYFQELKKELFGCSSILDVGCGNDSLLKYLPESVYREGVDAFEPYLEESRKKAIHHQYHLMNVLEIGKQFKENSFEAVYAGDLIEHLEKKDGFKLLTMMEKIAQKKVIVYTPNGFLPLPARDGNEFYIHLSGWEVEEMRNLGYQVIGTSGWKTLRGDDTGIRFQPKPLWRIISDITQFYTRNHPENAKQILCIKNLS